MEFNSTYFVNSVQTFCARYTSGVLLHTLRVVGNTVVTGSLLFILLYIQLIPTLVMIGIFSFVFLILKFSIRNRMEIYGRGITEENLHLVKLTQEITQEDWIYLPIKKLTFFLNRILFSGKKLADLETKQQTIQLSITDIFLNSVLY